MSDKVFIDLKNNLTRYIAQYDIRTEKPISRIDLADFDLRLFRNIWNILDPNDLMSDTYRISNNEEAESLRNFLKNPIHFEFSKYAYFFESSSYKFKPYPFIEAWKKAMEDLSIQGSLELVLEHPFRGKIEVPLVFLRHFGGEEGAVIISSGIDGWVIDSCHDKGYYISIININEYRKYNKSEFIEFLNSLGWFGPGEDLPNFARGDIIEK